MMGPGSRWFGTAAATAAASLAAAIGISAGPAAQDDVRSTQSGVYTAAQAARGETTFANLCMGCHTTAAYATPAFVRKWNGRPLSELYSLILDTMPEDFPGTLTPAENAQIVAYLLRLNRMPAGDAELPSDATALGKIRFDTGDR